MAKKTGIDLPGEIKGSVPTDISDNPTNLYAFAIGQHTLTVSPLQTSVCLSAFANHGHVLKPQIVKTIANLEPTTDPNFTKFLYRDYFTAVGLNFPLFTEAQEKEIQPLIKSTPSEVVQEIYLPEEIRTFLLGGLLDVVNGARGTARPATIRTLHEKPILKREYEEMRPTFGGKTSTAEAFYRPFLNRSRKPVICNHAWFGAIGFSNTETLDADLVVIVYLRYADYGKEAALIASRLLKKWRTLNNP